jgi:hypothetical protein
MSADEMNVSGPTAPGIGAFGPIGSVGQTGTAQEQLRMMQPQQPSASPFFAQGPASSGMVPGTISTPYNPLAMYQGPSAQGQLNYNPNLAPDMLGGFYNAGMMQDRLGNRIFAPSTPVFGFAKGGEADIDAMRALVDASNMADDEDEGPTVEDYASEARLMLQGMGGAPGAGAAAGMSAAGAAGAAGAGVVRRMPGSDGAARPEGMGMSAESLSAQRDFSPKATKAAKAAKPAKASKAAKSAKAQLKALARQYERQRGAAEDASEGLARRTLSSPTLEQPTLLEDSLTTRRFAKGGEAKKPEAQEVKTPSLLGVMKYATETSARMFPDQMGQDDQRDAARHMLAAASVAKKYGPRAADLLGRAHEYTSNPQTFFSALGVGQPRDDLAYDLHNNRLGAQLGKRASSQEELERLVEAMARQAQYEKAPDRPWVMSPEQIEERRQRAMQPQERPQYRYGGPVHRAMTRK